MSDDLKEFGFEAIDDSDLAEFGFEEELVETEQEDESDITALLKRLGPAVAGGALGGPVGALAGLGVANPEATKDLFLKAGEVSGLGGVGAGIGSAALSAAGKAADALGLTTDAKLREQGFDIPEESLLDAYYAGKGALEQEVQKAEERSPTATAAAYIPGILGTGAGVTKLAGAAASKLPVMAQAAQRLRAAKEGATLAPAAIEGALGGATSGALGGEAETLRGVFEGDTEQLQQTGKEALTGVGYGAAGGAVLGGLGALAKGAMKTVTGSEIAKEAGKAFKYGKEGTSLRTQDDYIREVRNASKLSDDLRKAITGKTKDVGKAIGSIKKTDAKVDLGSVITSLKNQVEDVAKGGTITEKDRKKILKEIALFEQRDLQNLSVAEADKISQSLIQLTDLQGTSPLVDKELKNIAIGASKTVGDTIKRDLDASGLRDLSSQYNSLKKLRDTANMMEDVNAAKIERQIDTFAKSLMEASDPTRKLAQFQKMDRFNRALKEASPKLHQQFKDRINTIQEKFALAETAVRAPKVAGTPATAAGGFEALTVKGANKLGQMMERPKDEIPSIMQKIRSRAGSMAAKAPMLDQLQKALDGAQADRAAILYGLFQQPAFREMIQDEEEN